MIGFLKAESPLFKRNAIIAPSDNYIFVKYYRHPEQ